MLKKTLITAILLLSGRVLFAQHLNLPLNREFGNWIDNDLNTSSYKGFTTLQPLLITQIGNAELQETYDSIFPFRQRRNWIARKLTQESFIHMDTAGLHLTIDPVMNLEYGKEMERADSTLYKNTRGILVRGSVGRKFSFESSFYETQSFLPSYADSMVRAYEVSPGMGRVKSFKGSGFDHAMSSGYITWKPSRNFFLQAGHGKHFIGNGYRSLLLSDNAFNYPYLKLTWDSKYIQYTTLHTSFQVIQNGRIYTNTLNEGIFRKKSGSFQFLAIKPFSWLEAGLFQGIIWQARDAKFPAFNAEQFNPVLFFNGIQYGWDNRNNMLAGATWVIKPLRNWQTYGQLVIDDVSKQGTSIHKRNGYQIGLRAFNLFTVKNLHLRVEYNKVRPFTYAHNKPAQSYTHYNQSLAHPLGSNFSETLIFLNYHYKRIFGELRYSVAVAGKDSLNSNFGSDPLRSVNTAWQGGDLPVFNQYCGVKTTTTITEARLSLLLNPVTRLSLFGGMMIRNLTNFYRNDQTTYVYLGIRTSLNNQYFDF